MRRVRASLLRVSSEGLVIDMTNQSVSIGDVVRQCAVDAGELYEADGTGAPSGYYSTDLDGDSGVLTMEVTGLETETSNQDLPVLATYRFVEVEKLLDALAGSDIAGRDATREFWRSLLCEKLDAHEL